MNKDKIIKDLKERNDKLKNQYQLQEIRLHSLEYKYKKQKEVLDKIKEYIEKNKTKLYQGRNEFNCEIQYSDEVVKAKEILELLEEIE